MRETLTTFGEISGFCVVVAGIAMLSVPFAFITAGLGIVAVSWLASEGPQ